MKLACNKSKLSCKQIVYICKGTNGALLSLEACVALWIVPKNFPSPGSAGLTPKEVAGAAVSDPERKPEQCKKRKSCDCRCPYRTEPMGRPKTLSFAPTQANIKRLEAWIRERYAASAFNVCESQALPTMHGPPVQINLDDYAVPSAAHSLIPVLVHW